MELKIRKNPAGWMKVKITSQGTFAMPWQNVDDVKAVVSGLLSNDLKFFTIRKVVSGSVDEMVIWNSNIH
jgi:hypothetical protein